MFIIFARKYYRILIKIGKFWSLRGFNLRIRRSELKINLERKWKLKTDSSIKKWLSFGLELATKFKKFFELKLKWSYFFEKWKRLARNLIEKNIRRIRESKWSAQKFRKY